MAWGLFREDSHRLRLAPSGAVLGVEYGRATARLEVAGVSPDEAEILLGACERGLVMALNEREQGDGDA